MPKVHEWEIQYQRYANLPSSDAKEEAANLYLPLWAAARKAGVVANSDEDAAILKHAIDQVEAPFTVRSFASAECDYNETMKAMDILEELK